MKTGHGPNWKRKPGQPVPLSEPGMKPKLVLKEVHGQSVWVKVYPPRYAQGDREELQGLGFKSGCITPAEND